MTRTREQRDDPLADQQDRHDAAVDALGDALTAATALLDRPGGEAGGEPGLLPAPRPGSPLAVLVEAFDLDAFSTGMLMLAVAREVVPGVDVHCARWNGSDDRPWLTAGMALAVLPAPRWDALVPTAPLRRHRLLRLGPGDVLTERPLLIEERVLHHLLGAGYVDPRVARRSRAVEPSPLVPSHRAAAEEAAGLMGALSVHLWSDTVGAGVPVAVAAARAGGRDARLIASTALPQDPGELDDLAAVLGREARLGGFVAVIDLDESADPGSVHTATVLAKTLAGDCLTTGVEACGAQPDTARVRVRRPGFDERVQQWTDAVADLPPVAAVPRLVARFGLDGEGLVAAVAEAGRRLEREPGARVDDVLWQAARVQALPRLEELAQRLDVRRSWDDLVLPDAQLRALRALVGHARQQAVVDHAWGFTPSGASGGGSAALLTGPSGTGKTLAAEVLAGELDLDLFRIDLSAVVSKYIGETEKNLRRVFDTAEAGGAVLLFDEADALFGKRTEVKDSHDRYANVEVSYLLQRMEAFGGLALLTTNHRTHLDEAFLRRIPFVVEFPFPSAEDRAEIWRRTFPPATPLDGVDVVRLSRLAVAGGSIRSIARNAAALAADADEPVTMRVLRVAAELEYDKLGRPLTPGEVAGWR